MSENYFNDDDPVHIECPNCLEIIPETYRSLGERSELTCGECGFVFIYDVKELKRKVNSAMQKILGTPPPNPNFN